MAQTQAAAPPKDPAVPVNIWITPVIVGWLIPGGGHFLLKRPGRGALIFASVTLMFLFGLAMRGMMFSPDWSGDVLTRLINVGGFFCNLANGALYIVAKVFGYSVPDMPGDVHDYGTKFLVTAGLLNILGMVDSYEIAVGKKD